ncbi:MAG: MarR family transcriptional regulator [Sphaerochaetaceae bacterium]|nr:MarR family transcriptional regulator [Sphaerochaetaceae bacterium]
MDSQCSDIPLLAQITRLQFQLMHQFLSDVGLYPGQFFVLQILSDHPEELSQKEIGAMLMIKPSSVNQIIVNLEKASFITRSHDTKDRRVMRVAITEKGEDILKQGKKKYDLIQNKTREGISSDDLTGFDRIASMMIANLKDMQ